MKGKKMSYTEMKIQINTELQEPPMYKVIFLNDNVTTVQFVVQCLVDHFSCTEIAAMKIANEINTSGSSVAAVMPFQIAEQKGMDIMVSARKAGFPLQIKIEKNL